MIWGPYEEERGVDAEKGMVTMARAEQDGFGATRFTLFPTPCRQTMYDYYSKPQTGLIVKDQTERGVGKVINVMWVGSMGQERGDTCR